MDTNIQTAVRRSISSDRFLADDFQFSYSSINKLLNVPMIFHEEYILGDHKELEVISPKLYKKLHSIMQAAY